MLIFPTGYFPPVGYFRLLMQASAVHIEVREHFIKQTIRNRCEILSANGRLRLSVPVCHENRWKIPINEVKIDSDSPWQQQHWKSIQSAYGQAAYFTYYRDRLEELFHSRHETLFDWNMACLQVTLRWLKVTTAVEFTTEFTDYSDSPEDLRKNFDRQSHIDDEPDYYQVFRDKHGFQPGLSILDLILNTGPEAAEWLER